MALFGNCLWVVAGLVYFIWKLSTGSTSSVARGEKKWELEHNYNYERQRELDFMKRSDLEELAISIGLEPFDWVEEHKCSKMKLSYDDEARPTVQAKIAIAQSEGWVYRTYQMWDRELKDPRHRRLVKARPPKKI